MTERTMRRRQVMLGTGAVAGGIAAGGLTSATAALADDAGRGYVYGSWLITRQNTGDPMVVTAVASFGAGGVLISHDISPAGPPGTGTWASGGGNRFRATFWTGFAGEAGPGTAGPTLRVRVQGRVERDMISGTYSFATFAPSGEEVDSGRGTFRGRRINA